LLLNYFRNLRADATLFYLTALKNESLLDVMLNSYQTMHRLATSDSIRYKLGSITEIDAQQSNVEAGFMLNNVFQSEVVWKMSMIDLGSLISKTTLDTLIYPTGDFTKFDRDFTLSQLIVEAQNNRADLLAALQNRDVSDKMVKLARANRILDLDLYSGVTYASYDYNIVAPTPSFTQVNAGLSIPLKFSNKYAGDLKMAHYTGMQADAAYRQIEIQIQNEVAQAYYNYMAVDKQVQQFNNGLLEGAQKVLEGKIYSYKRGETTLLEVLNAQRTYNDVHQAYHETLYNYAAALVELERAAGIWDINF
jgi:cobalt-zinc-cadmium efflux system outer membrane protein